MGFSSTLGLALPRNAAGQLLFLGIILHFFPRAEERSKIQTGREGPRTDSY